MLKKGQMAQDGNQVDAKGGIWRPDKVWASLKAEYQGTDLSLRALAAKHGISPKTMSNRAQRECWRQKPKLLQKAEAIMGEQLEKRLDQESAKAVELISADYAKQLEDTLGPWLAKKKIEHVKRSIKRAERAQKRLDKLGKTGLTIINPLGREVQIPLQPKDESYLAQADEKYDTIIRRNAGMNDNALSGGALTLNVLTDHAAVQVVKSGT